ncbi:IclR family transcriptional regulator [Amycolatopsis sp. K13G38]|uniref:IclR family transcriptional regulator n=1 Tax=Amycolatopsis acididurans TaxID=2724524 RepID=A0ABX1JI30_9PSEU|nr:IclR family transcriptional regulator [Amycolatopsis acididurans]NKQ58475.1 IclR family transcriptional regulator [Amycolatopsis acididurans]
MTAAGRLLSVLDAFAPGRSTLTLSEISRRAGLSLTTAHRLAGELVNWGALERDADGRYRIGLHLLELAALAPRGLELRELAQPFLEDLFHSTRAHVHLAVRDGAEVVYVETIRARGAVTVLSRLGQRWPLHATGTGLVLLAFAGHELQEHVLARPLKRYTHRTVTDPRVLRRTLAEVRRTGIAVAEEQLTLEGVAVAAPIRGPGDEVVAALGLVVHMNECEPRALVPVMTAAARGISRALGAPSAKGYGGAVKGR